MNMMLEKECAFEVFDVFTYAQLDNYSEILSNAIKELEELKKLAVLCEKDKKAVEYQRYIHIARSNRNTILCVMMAKEGDICQHTAIETIWLN